MSENQVRLLKANLKQLRLPTISAEFEKLAHQADAGQQSYQQYLLRLTELEVATRASNALKSRIKQAAFPVANFSGSSDERCSRRQPFSTDPMIRMGSIPRPCLSLFGRADRRMVALWTSLAPNPARGDPGRNRGSGRGSRS